MAVPKSKQSKMRTNSRCSANFYATAPTLVECPQCHALKEPHRVCRKCGYYNKVEVVTHEEKKKKDNQ